MTETRATWRAQDTKLASTEHQTMQSFMRMGWSNFIPQLHQPRLWFITGGYLVKRWFMPAAARARGQSNDLNRGILASNLFNCHNEVINAPPIPSISRCIHIVYRHKNVWEYQWSNFIYNCMSTFLHYVRCKDALLDCSAPGGERCESLTWVDEIYKVCNNSSMLWLKLIHVSQRATAKTRIQFTPIIICGKYSKLFPTSVWIYVNIESYRQRFFLFQVFDQPKSENCFQH